MALYEYRCQNCQHVFSVAQSISEHERSDSNPRCPECDGRNTRRIYSGFFAKTSSKS